MNSLLFEKVISKMRLSCTKTNLIILCDTVLLHSFPQVDGDCVLEFLHQMSED